MSRTDTPDADDGPAWTLETHATPVAMRTLAQNLPARLPGPARFWTVSYEATHPDRSAIGQLRIDHRWFDADQTVLVDTADSDLGDNAIDYTVSHTMGLDVVRYSRHSGFDSMNRALTTLLTQRLLPNAAPAGISTLIKLFN